MTDFIQQVSTKVMFTGGTEHGKTYPVWATREIVVVVQPPPVASADEVAKMDFKALMSTNYPKPVRQIYAMVRRIGFLTEYHLVRTETQ